jgi:hypothetical protein
MTTATTASNPVSPTIPPEKALEVARRDAEKVYRDLSRFRIQIALEPDGWRVEYWLKDVNINGGGPHYVIDAATGAILSKKYYQ